MKRATIIIPNENLLNAPPYYKDIHEDEFHGLGVKIFSNRYHLGITATSLGLEEEEYPGYVWQTRLCSLGHAVVCLGDCEPLVSFIPNVISENQYLWFVKNQNIFLTRKENSRYMIIDKSEKILEQNHHNTKEDAIQLMYNAIEKCRGRGILMQEESEERKR